MGSFVNYLKDIFKGVVIGVANAIPGVSGGTMMVSMGIYDDIIYCITHLLKQFKASILRLLPYIIGMAVGIVGLAYAITYLDERFPFQTRMVFIGLILGGIPVLWKRIRGGMTKEKKESFSLPHVLVFLIFFALILVIQYLGGQETKDVTLTVGAGPLLVLFFVGIVASATMVIPGVSGSMMLMIMGYYYPILNAIKDFIDGAIHAKWDLVLHTTALLVPFGIGVVFGIFAIAKLIEILMRYFESLTYSGILGLVVASPVVILMGMSLELSVGVLITGILAMLAGGAASYFMGE
ncbi:MAG: DUF368 domain-containing protein [Lachnospiraceae bacterium]|nr:DUF368 domain-containing protein [Lachnospiraceae bacterium]